jgi:two-component system, NarL family, response regulator DegU
VEKITLAIADDHKLFREGLVSIFRQHPRIQVVMQAENGQDLLTQISTLPKPNVVLMDLNMPILDGMAATEKLKKLDPNIKILILSMHNEEAFILKMLDLGANGYLLKTAEPEELIAAIETVTEKDYYFNDYINAVIIKGLKEKRNYAKISLSNQENLTSREIQCLELICQGDNSSEIADKMFISKRTVEFHRQNLLEKLSVKNTASLIVYAVKHGLINL